ncbi:hypothetical protein H261_08948 [Paramagnetospirillum caucaseum]|uniref:N-acetyltransferase domain-containing protein n=1 Tax=Paramagnetospirillum caucaseum TaxID=1244869 RepID=M2YB96_9PROT|nr:GNAT family N-acetyltransferase [Paramagnetospirillum caucaseum]EME70301.1 hypothetical protein H261_08948 [Paramagnetospirillum caucaseum]
MEFRRAEDGDCQDLLVWRNDPVTVRHSLTGAGVDAAAHRVWFARVLADSARILLIAEDKGEKLGMVRFDRHDDGAWEVGINLAPTARGRGLAAGVLAGAVAAAFPAAARPPLVAQVKHDNPASRRIFLRCGFVLADEVDGVGTFRLARSCGVGGRVP